MKQFLGKLLVAVDGSHSCLRAKEMAASLARKFGSKMTVVHVISHDFMHPELKAHHQLPSLILRELDKSFEEAGRKIIKNAEDFFREEKIEVETKLVRSEDAANKILLMIEESEYDLLVVGNISDSHDERYYLGNVAEKISLYAKFPVLVAKRKTTINKLLVAVDGSKQANKALEYAIQLCQHFGAKMTLIHVEQDELLKLEPQVIKQVGEEILAEAASKTKDAICDTRL
jgi:nucleotide-binding universal stress UspA family protein